MGEEQKEILQMVSDGKISADDGVKLLEALRVGQRKIREMESPASRIRKQKKSMIAMMKKGHVTDMSNMRDIGHMIRGIVSDTMSGFSGSDSVTDTEFNEEMLEDEGLMEDSLELEEGTELVLTGSRSFHKAGDLTLNGVSGSTCRLTGEHKPDVRVYRDEGTVVLKWKSGDLNLTVPETVSNVSARIMGGDIVVMGVRAQTSLKTRGGNIILQDTSDGFSAKTMGGDLVISLNERWSSDSSAATMGGNIDLSVNRDTRAIISAKTLGGEISVQEGLGEVDESGHHGASRVRIDLSGGEEAPSLGLKTMGGNIMVSESDESKGEEILLQEEESDLEKEESRRPGKRRKSTGSKKEKKKK